MKPASLMRRPVATLLAMVALFMGVATVFADSDKYPSFADTSGSFVYTRLMNTEPQHATGYPAERIDAWAKCARVWARGGNPAGLPRVEADGASVEAPREVFAFFISGAKERAPAAAVAMLKALSAGTSSSAT